MKYMKKLVSTLKHKIKVRHVIGLVILTLLFILGSYIVYVNEITPRIKAAYTQDVVPLDKKNSKIRLQQGEKIVQKFVFPKDQMIAVGVGLYATTEDNKGTLELKVYDDTTNELLKTAEYDTSQMIDMSKPEVDDYEYFNANMGTILSGNQGRNMRLELEVRSLSSKSKIYMYVNPNTKGKYETATITGVEQTKQVSAVVRAYCYQFAYWDTFWKLGNAVVYLTLFFSYIGLVVIKGKLHLIFLIAGGGLAICYTFLLPPLAVPDELVHITTAYYYSNSLLGIQEPDAKSIYIRQTDLEALSNLRTTPTLKEYDYFMWNVLRAPKSTQLITYDKTQESKNWILYIPTIIGITLARILGVNGATLLYMGRAFAVMAYLAILYFAIKKMPIVKGAFFLLAISPIVIQQCCSYSYDALPIALSMLFVAELFSLLYTKKKMSKTDYILLFFMVFFLASSKGGVYIPECLLIFLIPKDRFIKENGKKKFGMLMVFAMLLGFFINTIPYLMLVFGFSKEVTATQLYANNLHPYTISDVLLHPLRTLYILVNTLLKYADYYFEGIFGGPLGWLNIAISPAWTYLLAFLMFLGIIPVKNESIYMEKKQRIAICSALLVTTAMIVASMFVSWTSNQSTTVSGLQGRYFTPIFFLFLFTFRGKLIKLERNIDYVIAFLGIALNIVIINNILSSIQTVM